ncbi:MAG: FecCD family ABC transporter permease [Candidatus Omnitrophota bacterium]
MKKILTKQLLVLTALLFLSIVIGLLKGAVEIPAAQLLLAENATLFNMRLLRIFTAILVGSGLAVSGIVLQAILRNSLAEPYLLGTSSGAGLAAVLAVVIGISRLYLPLAAFLGAVASIVLVYHLALEGNRINDKSLILSGVIVSTLLSAVMVFMVSLFPERALHEMTWWLWGSLQVYDFKLILGVSLPVILGIATTYGFAQDLNAISLGEEAAYHLGIDTQKVKKILILITALITSSLICLCGIIGFVGLIVPHMMRLVVGPNHRSLIPLTCIAAAIFMVGCDILSRIAFAPAEVPIGVITAIIGAPVFMVLLRRAGRIS